MVAIKEGGEKQMSKHVVWSYDQDCESCEDYIPIDFEREALDIQLSGPIAVIADLGLWDGRRRAARIIESGNVKDTLSAEDRPTWYIEDGEFRCDDIHHDGTNHYFYREILDDDMFDTVIRRWIFEGFKLDEKELNRCTRSLAADVAAVYGFSM